MTDYHLWERCMFLVRIWWGDVRHWFLVGRRAKRIAAIRRWRDAYALTDRLQYRAGEVMPMPSGGYQTAVTRVRLRVYSAADRDGLHQAQLRAAATMRDQYDHP